ncbi:MAG: T9SS type A sorting domain-containing protein [Bacteroidota bacterium]
MQRFLLLTILGCMSLCCYAQYAPQAGLAGSTAISASAGAFVGWATGCNVYRGLEDIANQSLGYVTAGDSSMALGPMDHSIVSLGDSGIAVLTFDAPICNGPGADFAVFENGFANPNNAEEAFLELAFVEVSSDGLNFFRFPANSLTPINTQIPDAGVYMNARYLNNLAGKYIAGYGTPFDLQELAGISGLDINHVTHVRIVDVIGSIGEYATLDSAGRPINDPYPTAFATGGFDLDAVGVIHQLPTGITEISDKFAVHIYPNPTSDYIRFSVKGLHKDIAVTLTDIAGKVLQQVNLKDTDIMSFSQYVSGIYYLVLHDTNGNQWVEKITKL